MPGAPEESAIARPAARAVTIEFTEPKLDESVVGLVHLPEGGEPVAFAGWMSLLELLEPLADDSAGG